MSKSEHNNMLRGYANLTVIIGFKIVSGTSVPNLVQLKNTYYLSLISIKYFVH